MTEQLTLRRYVHALETDCDLILKESLQMELS